MEIIRINDNKLKVILTEQDMTDYALSTEELNYDNTETRRALWEILDEAKQKTGFNAAAERIFVQAYPDKKGGCEIYVTKFGEGERSVKREEGKRILRGRVSIFAFEDFNMLCEVCAKIHKRGGVYESAVFFHSPLYYLFIKEPLSTAIFSQSKLSPLSFVEEYTPRAKSNLLGAYIREHGECILPKNAIERLAAFGAPVTANTV
ncbi:MAG: adaptor protein MecA [Clostridia bacterium]|nr:adaptor protein MecA [Clostridia bacterium]